MSLATRCASCGTVFRVAQDQLKVSEGWVRCGRCSAVFNALEGLFDLGRETPPEWGDDVPMPSPGAAAGAALRRVEPVFGDDSGEVGGETDAGAPSTIDDLLAADPIDAHLFRNRREKAAVEKIVERDRLEFSDARFDSDLFADNAALAEPELAEFHTTGTDALSLEHAKTPEFLRRAERRARWRRAPVRLGLSALALVAALALGVQVILHYHDALAADWPATRPALLAACRASGCTIEAPRRIDDVSVESTALTRAAGADAFVLSVNLRSRSPVALTLPSVDLSLTDGNGRLVARRVLSPRDFHAAPVLPAGADAALQLMLSGSGARVAGYTVELFYP